MYVIACVAHIAATWLTPSVWLQGQGHRRRSPNQAEGPRGARGLQAEDEESTRAAPPANPAIEDSFDSRMESSAFPIVGFAEGILH